MVKGAVAEPAGTTMFAGRVRPVTGGIGVVKPPAGAFLLIVAVQEMLSPGSRL